MIEFLFCPQHGVVSQLGTLVVLLPILRSYLLHPAQFLHDILSNIRYLSNRNHGAF